jgi:hypothetical protein
LRPFSTKIAFLPELSGLTERELIESVGFAACSKCFPTAPTFAVWIKGQAAEEAAKAAKVAALCPGSGKYAKTDGRRRYVACPECGKFGAVTPYGMVRAHKPEAAK